MVLPNGRVLRLPGAFLVPLLPCSRMGRCVALLTVRCIPRSDEPPRDGSLRVLYAARIGHCRTCLLRAQCQESSSSLKPRRVSALFWPLEAQGEDSSPLSKTLLNPCLLLRCCGKTGHAAASGEHG